MRKLRIAVWYNLNSGGSKRALYDQLSGLAERGHHVETWCPPGAEMTFLPVEEFVAAEHVVPLAKMPARPGNPIGKRRHFARESSYQAAALERHCEVCGEQMRAGKFDILLSHPCRFFQVSPIGQNAGLPCVLYLQEPYRSFYEAIPQLPWVAPEPSPGASIVRRWNDNVTELLLLHSQRVQMRHEQTWARAFDQILVNSQFSRESVLRAYNLDARVCYLGIDTAGFSPSPEPKEPFVIGLGSLAFNKRPVLAVQAVGAIPAAQRPKLVWVGDRIDQAELAIVQETARLLGVDFNLKTLISDQELQNLLSRAAVLIYTSKLEPFGYAPLEANACETGVVAIAEGGIRETVAHPESGRLVIGSDPELFARELVKFTNDLTFAKEFGRKARLYVEGNWSLGSSIDRLEAEMERVLTIRRNGSLS